MKSTPDELKQQIKVGARAVALRGSVQSFSHIDWG
jgi:hypothetical protein